MSEHKSLTAALAAFQKTLPKVGKNSLNPHFKSKYASLEDITEVVVPALGAHGLAWIATPRITEHGFVLAYELRHESGESITGEWPLLDSGNAQALGSALTYARRYTLTAVTGVAPDEDDDGNAAVARAPQKAQKARPKAPEGWRGHVVAAESQEALTGIYERAQAEGWLSDDVVSALGARKKELLGVES